MSEARRRGIGKDALIGGLRGLGRENDNLTRERKVHEDVSELVVAEAWKSR